MNSDMKNRAKMYETTKTLYQTLNQNEVLDVLRANHSTVRELILSIDPNADLPPIPVPQEVRGESLEMKHTVTGFRSLPAGFKLKVIIAAVATLSVFAILLFYVFL